MSPNHSLCLSQVSSWRGIDIFRRIDHLHSSLVQSADI